jgi:hypothetical protein
MTCSLVVTKSSETKKVVMMPERWNTVLEVCLCQRLYQGVASLTPSFKHFLNINDFNLTCRPVSDPHLLGVQHSLASNALEIGNSPSGGVSYLQDMGISTGGPCMFWKIPLNDSYKPCWVRMGEYPFLSFFCCCSRWRLVGFLAFAWAIWEG